jgi:hypothetical protein
MTISKIGGVGSNPTEGTTFDVRFEDAISGVHAELIFEISYEAREEPDAVEWMHLATPVYDELKEQIKC